MTEDLDTEPKSEINFGPPGQYENRDWLLSQIVDWANATEARFLVTLNVGGCVVSGLVVSGRDYFDALSDVFADQFSEDTKEAAKAAIVGFKVIYPEPVPEAEDNTEDLPRNPPMYIHLLNAQIWHNTGSPMPSDRGVIWRGKISSVDAFWLGNLRVADENAQKT